MPILCLIIYSLTPLLNFKLPAGKNYAMSSLYYLWNLTQVMAHTE